uniref:Putative secreted protein n=1 Tax=Panstrongylus lignarius TaxID=156445 RepID=A0A224XTN8_9HEMI
MVPQLPPIKQNLVFCANFALILYLWAAHGLFNVPVLFAKSALEHMLSLKLAKVLTRSLVRMLCVNHKELLLLLK